MEKNKPCRDYEEQGFCVYGETCQYSHGTNPVVLDGVNAGLILTSTVSTTATTGSTTTISTTHQSRNNKGMNTRSGMKKSLGSSGFSSSGQQRNNSNDGGLSQNHHSNSRHHNNSNNNSGSASGSSNNNNNHQQHQNHNHNHNNNSNHNHNNSGINYRHSGANTHHRHSNNNSNHNNNSTQHNNDKCKLEVKRVPQHQNTIKDLNEHFSKFGTIVNIQVNYEGDPEGALIQYSSPHEAIAAYRSPEAVFNNRFIRVHWHFKSDLSNANHDQMHDNNSGKRSYNIDINDDGTINNNSNSTSDHTTNNNRQKGHHQSILQQQQQQQQINRVGKKRSVLMRLGAKSVNSGSKNTSSTKSNNNQTTDANDDNSKLDDDDDDDHLNDEPPAKLAPNDPDCLNLVPTAAANKLPIKSRRELNLHNKQQQDINNATNNKKKVQKQGVEIQRKQSDLLTNLIHQQKILIKKIESSTEEKERASLKSILDELTQKTKDLMTKTSLKQSIIRSNQPIAQAHPSSSAAATSTTTASSANATTTTTTTTAADSAEAAAAAHDAAVDGAKAIPDAQEDSAKTECPAEPCEGRDNNHD